MSQKHYHSVFQTRDFLEKTELHLFPSDSAVLMILASHKGNNGIFPSLDYLSKVTKFHRDTIHKAIQRLEKLNLIVVQRKNGYPNHYELLFIHNQSIDTTGNQSYSTTGTNIHPSYDTTGTSRLTPFSLLNKKLELKEREEKPLSVDNFNETEEEVIVSKFKPTETHHELAKRLGIDDQTFRNEVESFKNRSKALKNFDYEFQRWLEDGQQRRLKNRGNNAADNKPYQHPSFREFKHTENEPVILSKLLNERLHKKLNGHGGPKFDITDEK